MLRSVSLLLVLGVLVLLLGGSAIAGQDYPGSEDHPLLERFPGSFIYAWEYWLFDEYVVPTGPIVERGQPEEGPLPDKAAASGRDQMLLPQEGFAAAGEVTKITYIAPEDRSLHEIYSSYLEELETAGFDVLFTATNEGDMGPYASWHAARYGIGPEHRAHQLREAESKRLITATLDHDQRPVHITLYFRLRPGGREYPGQVRVQLDIVEEDNRETGLVTSHPEYERTLPTIEPMAYDDYEGGSDHQVLSRFTGSFIYAYEHAVFDQYAVATGRVDEKDLPDEDEPLPDLAAAGSRNMIQPTTGVLVEGAVTKLTYVVPAQRSALEVFRSYKEALESADVDILFTASGEREIGRYQEWHEMRYGEGPEHRAYRLREADQEYYVAARLPHDEGDVYAAIYIMFGRGDRDFPDNVRVQVDIVEEGDMDEDLVSAESLRDQLRTHGSAAVQDIHFAFDSAKLLPESANTLDAIAGLLEADPQLELLVVGHTDDKGALDYNVDLSRRRAEAVATALSEDYGVAAGRLTPLGVGPAAPTASNLTEEGRAQNRRVELVERID